MSLPTPITRKESYLAAIAGEEVQVPEKPITREEAYLAAIAEGGGGGKIIIDPVPTQGSTNAVSSGGTYTALEGKLNASEKGTASGVAELDANGKVLSSQLPSFVDDVVEGYYDSETDRFYEESTFETVIDPVGGKLWVDIPANKSYRWTGTVYVRVDEGVQIGETSNSAFRGDWGKTLKDTMGTGTLDTEAQTVIPAINELKENIPTLKTATGNPIVITDAANANAEELLMTIEPIQSGSGDPSPTNVRPISGISTASVQTTNGEDTNTASTTLGRTVYGGSVDFKTGEVTVTHGYVEYDGSNDEDWGSIATQAGSTYRMKITPPSDLKLPAENTIPVNAISNQYMADTANNVYTQHMGFAVQFNGTYLAIYDPNYNTPDMVNAWKSHLSNTPLTICYELATPTTLTLTPAELELLKGNNTITANGAEISLSYYPDNAIGALAERVDNKADITYVDNAVAIKTEYFKSSSSNTTQTINIGAISENRLFLFACGFHTNYVLELIVISANGASVVHVPVANSSINSISAISYNASTGVMTITVENNPFCYGRMTRLS